MFVNRMMSCMMPAMMLVMNGISVLIMWNGAHGVDSGAMQVGDMMAVSYTHLALFKNHYGIRISYCRKSVSDNKYCSSLHYCVHAILNKPLSSCKMCIRDSLCLQMYVTISDEA